MVVICRFECFGEGAVGLKSAINSDRGVGLKVQIDMPRFCQLVLRLRFHIEHLPAPEAQDLPVFQPAEHR